VTVVGFSVLATLQAIDGFVFDSIQCPGIRSGVFEAGAKPSLIAAIGSGYLIALVNPKSARYKTNTPMTMFRRTLINVDTGQG
jgi:hypothetical protein